MTQFSTCCEENSHQPTIFLSDSDVLCLILLSEVYRKLNLGACTGHTHQLKHDAAEQEALLRDLAL